MFGERVKKEQKKSKTSPFTAKKIVKKKIRIQTID